METGIELIHAERLRQIEVEGWTPEHDAKHADGELGDAAIPAETADRILKAHALWVEGEHRDWLEFMSCLIRRSGEDKITPHDLKKLAEEMKRK